MEHNFKFTDVDCLIILNSLDCFIKDKERNTVDRVVAIAIEKKILETVKKDKEK